jgi:hypothetical protein
MELWFVTGSQHLYDEQTLKTVAAHAFRATNPRGPWSHNRAGWEGLQAHGERIPHRLSIEDFSGSPLRIVSFTDWPHISSAPLGIAEFTVFGKAVETAKP